MCRFFVRSVVAVTVLLSVVVGAAPAAADVDVVYAAPVDAPVTDPFRAPPTPYGPGHRGIEYGTAPGTTVHAAADGTVTFAGAVAGTRWVTIRHADGVRTTYGPMATIAITEEAPVARGSAVGTTSGALLFTARVDDGYVDPATLLDGVRLRVYLVPEADLGALARAREAMQPGWFERGRDALSNAIDWEVRHLAATPDLLLSLTPAPVLLQAVDTLVDWRERRDECTPATVVPAPPVGRRVVVLVGGLGSSSENAAVAEVDTGALGYAPADVLRFSYAGGRVPPVGDAGDELEGLPATPYGPRDTVGDIEASGARLAELLQQVTGAMPPGVTVDVVAHSQGGLVTRAALARLATADPEAVSRLGVVATLATPHGGADLAEVVRAADENPLDPVLLDAVASVAGLPVSPDDPAVRQLVPGSDVLSTLASTPLPRGPRYLSVAARGDLVVPSGRARLDGATNVVVPVDGVAAHDELPGSAVATRELALALAGARPTCESAADAVLDATAGLLIRNFEHAVAATQGA